MEIAGSGARRHQAGGRRVAPAALLVGVVLLAGCGEVATVAGPAHDAVSAVPTSTVAPAPVPSAGVTSATITPTPTPTIEPPSGGTVLTGGTPTRLTFGMHVSRIDAGAWPSVPVGAFRIWNADSTWGALEPSPGQWDFARLDARVELARSRNAAVLLVLSHPPGWASTRPDLHGYGGSPAPPRDLAEWRTYVATVAARYAGRIEAYEIWNEPNLAQFFVGSAAKLGELTRVAAEAINATDPQALVVSAGFSARTGGAESYFRDYVASGIASAIDVVGIHIYPYPGNGPESMVGLAQRFRGIANGAGLAGKPMWNTEIGYGRTPDYIVSESAGASLVLRTYLVLPAAGLVRNYWYMWDDRSFIGLYLVGSDHQSPTSAGYSFGEAQRWLVGAELDSCRNAIGTWVCTLQHVDGPTVTIAWSISGERTVPVPDGATIAYRFGGSSEAVTAGAEATIDSTPILFSPTALPSLG